MEPARRYRSHWQDEVDSAAQYRALAGLAEDPRVGRIFERLALSEEAHVAFWEERLKRAGVAPGRRKPSWRARVLILVARRFGTQLVLPAMAANEGSSRHEYRSVPETRGTGMSAQERWHAKVLHQISRSYSHGAEGAFLGSVEGRHRAVGGNALRAAVLGANDGLCSNLALVMGAAGAAANPRQLLITGLAGLLAGAFSMALGEWISVTSSRELATREIRIESDELAENPQGEAQELQLIYEAKGLGAEEARSLAQRLVSDPGTALDTLAREELGIDPSDPGGSPWTAAIASFCLFAVGAAVPVAPLAFAVAGNAVAWAAAASALGLFLTGAAITVFTGQPAWKSGLRQLALGMAAAGITYGIGRWLGVALG